MSTVSTTKCPQPSYINSERSNSDSTKKLGFDLHGVINTDPAFKQLMSDLIEMGWQIHILTGSPWESVKDEIQEAGIPFTHFFSILDHHVAIGTSVEWDTQGNGHIDAYLWNVTKAIYCQAHMISMHFDDSDIYGLFFKTPYIRYYSKTSERVQKIHH